MMQKAYTFDDVALVPQFNNVPSRTEPLLESWLTKNRKISMPLLAANMDTVLSKDLARVLIKAGTVPILHRFLTHQEQLEWVNEFEGKIFISSGLRDLNRTRELLDAGALGVCIDVAHGHSKQMFDCIESLKNSNPEHEIIAGNVCTAMAYHDLVNAGADAVKVGIDPGAACTTRMVTGFGIPQFTAIRECASIANKLRVPLIADGGIRSSRDIVLALAAGASSVMIGKLFALTYESAAEKRTLPSGVTEARYRGQASQEFQEEFYGKVKEKTVAEGVAFWAEIAFSAEERIEQLLGGLRSGMTYGGARSLVELQRKAEFVEVTDNYSNESKPRCW